MRTFILILDSLGIGELPDSDKYGDSGSNTFLSLVKSNKLFVPTLENLGFGLIDNVCGIQKITNNHSIIARIKEVSKGKDSTVGHFEIGGIIVEKPLPTYPNGFSNEILKQFKDITGYDILCNSTFSGTEVIKQFGEEHIISKKPIVYSSADSVLQVACHEKYFGLQNLYQICEVFRKIMTGNNAVGRVIARPFLGENKNDFYRTSNRKDYSLTPFSKTFLDYLKENNKQVIAVGKINDLYNSQGITQSFHTNDNDDVMSKINQIAKIDFDGLCYANLVDFDMIYGHRNDVLGYTNALNKFDKWLDNFVSNLKQDDILIITADHGCDPATPSTDHSREYTPLIIYGKSISGKNKGTIEGMYNIAKTVLHINNIKNDLPGISLI